MSSRLTKTLACLGVLTCAVAVAPLGPATVAASARQPPSAEERLAAYDEALVALTQELSYLVLLGWVKEPVPDGARTLPAAIGIEPMDTADMVDALAYLDGQRGPAALQQLRAIGERVPTQVDQVLSPNVSVHAEDHPVIVTRPIGEPEVTRTIGIVERRSGRLSPPARQFRDLLLAE